MTQIRELTPHHYDPSRGQWSPIAVPEPPCALPDRLTVVTWNVWFGQWAQLARWRALLAEVAACRPDVLALQEVTPTLLALLCETPWLRDGFRLSVVDPRALGGHYGEVLAVRRPVHGMRQVALPTQMGRALSVAELCDGDDDGLSVATVHLESLRSSGEVRRRQLAIIDDVLDDSGARVLMGDMNYDDGAPEAEVLGGDWCDSFLVAGTPDDPGHTMDAEVNHMLATSGGDRLPRVRFDRVFVRGERWRPVAVRRLGTEALADDMLTFPSDHFGLCVHLARAA